MDNNIVIQRPVNKLLEVASWLMMALLPAVYLLFVNKYAVNAPRQDDYDAILGFLNDFQKGTSTDKFSLLFSQHNEHRILFSRLLFVAWYKIAGVFNFRGMIFINFGILTLIYLLFIAFARKLFALHWQLAAVIAGTCLYSINSFENGDFAMAGSQNYGIILLFMASMYCYGRKSIKWLPAAILLQALCVFTSGNGNVAAFFLVVFTLLNRYRPATIAAVVTFVVVSPLYYYHYVSPGSSGFLSLNPMRFIPYFIHVIGAHFGRELSLAAGIALLVGTLWLLPKGGKWQFSSGALPFICIAAFAFCSAGVLSVFRAGGPVDTAYSSRYFIYSNIITLILSLWLLITVNGQKSRLPVTIILVLGLSFIYIRNIREGKEGFAYFQKVLLTNEYYYPDVTRAKAITDESCRLGIYCKQAMNK